MKTDRRLIGTWRSDRRRTLRELRFRPGIPRKKQKTLRGIFGKLQVTYTRNRVRYVLDEYRATRPCEILASDSLSVAIRFHDEITGEWCIQHIHFDPRDPDRYWVSFGWNREWFRRVEGSAAQASGLKSRSVGAKPTAVAVGRRP